MLPQASTHNWRWEHTSTPALVVVFQEGVPQHGPLTSLQAVGAHLASLGVHRNTKVIPFYLWNIDFYKDYHHLSSNQKFLISDQQGCEGLLGTGLSHQWVINKSYIYKSCNSSASCIYRKNILSLTTNSTCDQQGCEGLFGTRLSHQWVINKSSQSSESFIYKKKIWLLKNMLKAHHVWAGWVAMTFLGGAPLWEHGELPVRGQHRLCVLITVTRKS